MQTNDRTSILRSDTYDVVVVGGRAAGAATAMLLARAGLRTLLLERGTLGADTLSTHALMRGAVLQLSRWGVLDQIVDAGTPPVRRTTFRYDDDRIVISIKPSHGVDALYAPRRTLLDPVLVDAARDAGADVFHRTPVTALLSEHGRVIGVRAVAVDGRFVDIHARVVIGADGIRSVVARDAGAPFTRIGEHATATTYAYFENITTDGYEWVFRPDACAGFIPTNHGATCVFAGASAARIGRGGVPVITDILREGAPDLAAQVKAAPRPRRGTRTWLGHLGYVRESSGPGWALVGDAGLFIDPISAHGLTDALRDAELLARALTDGLGGAVALDTALARYQATRDHLSIPLFDIADRIAGQQWDSSEIAELLLQLSSATADEIETLAALTPLAQEALS